MRRRPRRRCSSNLQALLCWSAACKHAARACAACLKPAPSPARPHSVRVLCPGADASRVQTEEQALRLIDARGTDGLGFLQFFHLHRASAAVRALLCGPRLAGVAAQLLGAKRVRLFQDAGRRPRAGQGAGCLC